MKSIRSIRPLGPMVLVEILNPQEKLQTSLIVNDDVDSGAPQGVIRAVGTKIPEGYEVEVGDRVLLSGKGTPVPLSGENNRKVVLMDVFAVKGVVLEEE